MLVANSGDDALGLLIILAAGGIIYNVVVWGFILYLARSVIRFLKS